MNKGIKIATLIILVLLMVLSMPFMFITITGAIMGSFETYLTQERIDQARPIYIAFSVVFVLINIVMIIGVCKLMKSIRSR